MKLKDKIAQAVASGEVPHNFTAADLRGAVSLSYFARSTFSTFLPKHREGNPGGYNVFFVRVAPGVYRMAE
ncbi:MULTISPECIES: hypothetical protein [unclassified Brucella]|uniref:hypothetical protein n=1 Tax=unclassified Brucella TaxID=2632610 RepID=UPI0012AE38D5|nr:MULTISPECIES: hypothetical protein [unclassified Brucella]